MFDSSHLTDSASYSELTRFSSLSFFKENLVPYFFKFTLASKERKVKEGKHTEWELANISKTPFLNSKGIREEGGSIFEPTAQNATQIAYP